MDEINIGDIERVLNDTRPVTSVDEAQDQQPVHSGGAASGVVLPGVTDGEPGDTPEAAPAERDEPAHAHGSAEPEVMDPDPDADLSGDETAATFAEDDEDPEDDDETQRV